MSRIVDGPALEATMRMTVPQSGTHERGKFVAAGQQLRRGATGGTTVGRLGGGFRVGCRQRGRGEGKCQGADHSAERRVGREHAEVVVTVDA